MRIPKIFNLAKYSFKKIVLLTLILVVFLSMAIFGINRYTTNNNSSNFITVGNINIPARLFLAEYNVIVQQNAQILNQNPYMLSQILQGMLSRHVSTLMFVNEANTLHIGASEDLIYKIISNTPFFQQDGKFDRAVFKTNVSKIFGSEENYINTLKNDLKQTQLTGILVNSFYESEKLSRYFITSLHQSRDIEYVVFSRDNIKITKAPTNAELVNLRDQNTDIFTVPEFRTLQILEVNTADYLSNVKVSDAEIEDFYKKNTASFLTEETRDIAQILFDTEQEANDFYNANKTQPSLTNFKDKMTTLHNVDKATLPTELADVVFQSNINVMTHPIKTDLGYHVIVVTKINASQPKPLSAVKERIKSDLLSTKLATLYEDLKAKLTESATAQQSLSDIAKNFKCTFTKVTKVNKYGFDEKNNVTLGIAQHTDILKPAFELPLNQISAVLVINNKFYLVQPTHIYPEYLQTVEQAKNDLTKLWQYNQATAIIRNQAEKFIESFNINGRIDYKKFPVQKLTLTRQKQQNSGPFNDVDLDQIFLSKKNTPIEGTLSNGDIYVVITKKIRNNNKSTTNQQDTMQIKEYISSNFKEDILTQLFAELSTAYKVKINHKALQDLLTQ